VAERVEERHLDEAAANLVELRRCVDHLDVEVAARLGAGRLEPLMRLGVDEVALLAVDELQRRRCHRCAGHVCTAVESRISSRSCSSS
jgi:hypothetical protein